MISLLPHPLFSLFKIAHSADDLRTIYQPSLLEQQTIFSVAMRDIRVRTLPFVSE